MTLSLEQNFFRKLMFAGMFSVIALSMLTYYAASELLLADLRAKGDIIGRILAVAAKDAERNSDDAAMEQFVREISHDPFVVSLRITRTDGVILAAAGIEESVSTYDLAYPIDLGEDVFGMVVLQFSTTRLKRITWIILSTAILAVILLHLVGLVVNRLVLQRTVIRPLHRLRDAISTVNTENLEHRIAMEGPVEFKEIASAFNTMADRIKIHFDELLAQRAHSASEERKLAAIVASIADGLFVTDEDGVILSFNTSAERITGYNRAEALGNRCESLFQTSLCRDACALMHENEALTGIETTLVTKEGKTRAVAVSSAVLYDDQGRRCGGVQTFRDITEEKRRLDAFCRTEKMVAVGQLVAGVTHEINNPLANILGYAKLLRPGDDPARIEARREVIIEQAEKCHQIVRQLLDYSRTSVTHPRTLDINALLQRLVAIMELQLKKKDIRLELELNRLPFVTVDARKAEQLFFNLLLNAVQAVEKEGTIVLKTWLEKDMIMAAIADDGPGIPMELRSRIFDPFFTTKQAGKGTGLGLAICEGIVAEMNGHLEQDNSPYGGAQFTVSFPVTRTRGENP